MSFSYAVFLVGPKSKAILGFTLRNRVPNHQVESARASCILLPNVWLSLPTYICLWTHDMLYLYRFWVRNVLGFNIVFRSIQLAGQCIGTIVLDTYQDAHFAYGWHHGTSPWHKPHPFTLQPLAI
ncbi:hypothetical protein VNO77_24869 [Canavalia gladiata]|uniref:Uncharacterized protein n=1 Tax=Canavalia gladiata TaxID=3824 RepID=A0AAN9L8H6_CANGL